MIAITVTGWPPPIAQRAPLLTPGHIVGEARAQARDIAAVVEALEAEGVAVELGESVEPTHPLDLRDYFVVVVSDEGKARRIIDEVRRSLYLSPREFVNTGLECTSEALKFLFKATGLPGFGIAAEVSEVVDDVPEIAAGDLDMLTSVIERATALVERAEADRAAAESGAMSLSAVPADLSERLRRLRG